MREPGTLYQLTNGARDVPSGLPLVAGLTGFADAGGAVSGFTDYLTNELRSDVIAEFDTDELLDYRARRPTMYFDQDHLTAYRPPKLRLSLARDDLDTPFLLLTGFEPDFHWEAFVAAVLELTDRFEVSTTVWVHAIPMPVPHTRPIGVTVSGNRADLIESLSIWRPHTQLPATALHLLEHRLHQRGSSVAGFVLLVPHYLADTEFPMAALAALDNISAGTGLIFPTDSLREEGREFVSKIEEQVRGNAELERLVHTLEVRHDSYMEDNPLPSPLMDESGELPSAETIAAELERFLAGRRDDQNGGKSSGR
ncbi:proteasome assembly chaperone family protein [Ruicaihuangia caeni]|uniref:PAC2 family protein n=1 Tax=Ruicaihuangia caeni TaxID=3042517 RepID=A0AAW6T6N8_9MICO|nr:PAC2 family protein [Klugiella sp. YN-L-19]MDI2098014.1 PAC2 family protein [Klugiella sp. YN-L-19]